MYYLICKQDEQDGLQRYWNRDLQRWQTYRSRDCRYQSVLDADRDVYFLQLDSPGAYVTDRYSLRVTPGYVYGIPVAMLQLV